MRTSVVMITGLAVLATVGCHRSKGGNGGSETPQTETSQAPAGEPTDASNAPKGTVTISSGTLPVPRPDNSRIDLQNGDFIALKTIRGQTYLTVEATFDDASFKRAVIFAKQQSTSDAELVKRLGAPLKATIDTLGSQVGGLENVRVYPRYGFFTGMMKLARFESLRDVKGLPSDLVLNPVVMIDLGHQVQKMDKNLVDAMLADPRASTDAFSGLKQMGVPEFVELVKADLGADVPDGSLVKVGVTDTGVTFNHPTFENAEGVSRVVYMKDFTGEGRVFFNPAAVLEVTTTDSAEKLAVKADIVKPVAGAAAVPVADDFAHLETEMLVSPELATILTTAGNGAKLGVLSEASFASDTEKVDLNQNGKTDDALFLLLVPAGDASYKVYFSSTGSLDFRRSVAVGNFNTTKETVSLVAEKFGFAIEPTELQNGAGQPVSVVAASIVGFDPGNHGTHVSGIIAGRKTINNDSDLTLARGSAPAASLMVNRVCANNGGCSATEAFTDLAQNGAELINMSLGGLSAYNDGYDVQEMMIDRISEQSNVLFVISAGNSGPGINTVGSPSTARRALSVGAAASRSLIERQYQWPAKGKPAGLSKADEDNDFMLFFSSRGPTAAGGFKPNISAPGTELSSVQLNSANGQRSGLDVYWGTSMAAPSATGAIALLLDAAKRFNAAHPAEALPIDSLTLHKVLIASARPFDVTRFDPGTGASTTGQYTWIDQGTGMINLPAAWAGLKAERDSRLPSTVYAVKDGVREDVRLDYQVRVLRTNPNGIAYDGTIELPADMMALSGPRFGRGIWLDAKASDSLIHVQIARRLPFSAVAREDAGELKRLLVTSKDDFVLKTVFYGSNQEWLKAGSMNQLDCATAPTGTLSVLGEGAIDNFGPTSGTSVEARDSTLYACIDRALLSTLPAGDHGALILAYRKDGDRVEANAEFIVPVYVTIPQKTLAGQAGYEKTGVVQSFGVDRHYVDVPEGTSLVTVTLEVKAASQLGPVVTGCGAARLYAFEAGNTTLPTEIGTGIAKSCDDFGVATPQSAKVTYSRTNPKAGLWNLHIFGRYQFPTSEYKLTVQYAKVKTSVDKIAGTPDMLDGTLDFQVLDASFDAKPAGETSTLKLSGLAQETLGKLTEGEQQAVANADGEVYRSFDASVVTATFATGGSAGNDIDLYALECATAQTAIGECTVAGQSAGSTDVETVSFAPKADKFYVALAIGYAVSQNEGKFTFTEGRALKEADTGTVTVSEVDGIFKVAFELDQAASKVLANPLFLGGKYTAVGDLTLRTADGSVMVSVPVEIKQAEAGTH